MTTKERWELCAKLGPKLGLTKQQMNFGSLLKDIIEYDFVEDILNDDPGIIRRIKTWSSYIRTLEFFKIKENENDNIKKFKIALWFIKKMGGHEEARRILEIAIDVTNKLS